MTSGRACRALCCAGLLVLAGAACGKTTNPSGGAGGGPGTGGVLPGTGGESPSGGATGTGGATGVGGTTPAGGTTSAGGASTGGAKGSGGVAGGGSGGAGAGGVTGTAGTTTNRDAAATDSALRDSVASPDLATRRDVAVDAPSSQDAETSAIGDGGCVPNYACKPVAPNTGDIYADCVARINQFRDCVCLPPLPRWTTGEACADQDSKYDSEQNSAHAGFIAGICSSGNAQDECPDWSKSTPAKVIDGCLQMMFDEGPPPAGTCTGQCYTDHGHYINMTGTKYKSGAACGFYTTASGSIWAAQNFQ